MLPVYVHPLFLVVGPFIPLHAEPLKTLDDVPGILVFLSLFVCILNAKDKHTVFILCIYVVEHGGPRTADMEISCWAWRKPCFDH